MALSFRNPVDEAISCFSSSEQSLIATTAIDGYRSMERDLFHFFNYHMPAFAKEQLIGAGLYLSPYSGVPHSHPVCKTLENDILYRVLPSLIDASYYMVGIKQSKFAFLKQRGNGLDLLTLINRYVTSADKLRYGSEFHASYSKPVNIEGRSINFKDCATLRDLIPVCVRNKARKLFLHDELHYWKLKELRIFLEVVKPETLLGTLVYPPELLRGIKRSLNTWCYDFEVKNGDVLFYPDGVRTESYCQPEVGGFLLKASKIVLQDGTVYCVDLIYSKFAHHLVAITRGEAVTKKYNCFSNFQATTWHGLSDISIKNFGECIDIPFRVICGVYKYLRTLNKPDTQSAIAKLSQLLPDHTGYHLNFIRAFSELVIKTEAKNYVFKGSVLEELKAFVGRMFPARLACMFDVVKAKCLDDFVWMMQPYTFKVELKTFKANAIINAIFDEEAEIALEPESVVHLLDRFTEPDISLDQSFCSTPYTIGPFADVVETSTRLLAKLVFLYSKEYFRGCKKHEMNRGLAIEMYFLAKDHIGLLLFHRIIDYETDPVITELVQLLRVNWLVMLAPRAQIGFGGLGLRWFLLAARKRFNCKALTHYPDQPGKFLDVVAVEAWGMVCSEIKSGCGLAFIPDFGTSQSVCESDSKLVLNQTEEVGSKFSEEDSNASLEPIVTHTLFRCLCNLEISGQNVRGLDLIPMYFPDCLRGRRAAWYTKGCLVPYAYNGGSHQSLGWPQELSLFLALNDQSTYGYDCVLIQEYEEGSNLGMHADDEAIFEPSSPICTVQVRGDCVFKFLCYKHTSRVQLIGPQMFTMPPGFQENHKHGLEGARDRRVSCTFRILKRTGQLQCPPSLVTLQEDPNPVEPVNLGSEDGCIEAELFGVPTKDMSTDAEGGYVQVETVGDGNCFYHACSFFLGLDHSILRKRVANCVAELGLHDFPNEELELGSFVTNASIAVFSRCFNVSVEVYYNQFTNVFATRPGEGLPCIPIQYESGHYTYLKPRNDCVVTALMEAFQRPRGDIVGALMRRGCTQILDCMRRNAGISIDSLTVLVKNLSVHAYLHESDGNVIEVNTQGKYEFHFRITQDHIEFIPQNSKHSVLQSGLSRVHSEICAGELELTLVSTKVKIKLSRVAAEKLVETLNEGLTGVLCSKLFNGAKEFPVCIPPGKDSLEVSVHFMLGVFGCGKSTLYSNALSKGLANVGIFVTPRKLLAEGLREVITGLDLEIQPKVLTFEVFLKRAVAGLCGEVVIFDECQLYPTGFFDLALPLILKNGTRQVFLVGDPCQSDYDNEKDRAKLTSAITDMERFLHDQTYGYYSTSYRFINPDFYGRVPCKLANTDPEQLDIIQCYASLEEVPNDLAVECLLVASFTEKKAMASYFQKVGKVMTFGESTGLTFTSVAILITESAIKTSERRWVTALTRSRKECTLISNLGVAINRIEEIFEGRALGGFLGRTAKIEDLQSLLPGSPRFLGELKSCRIGKDHSVKEEKLRGDPWLKAMVFLGQDSDVQVEEMPMPETAEEVFKTHLPRNELESLRAKWVDRFKAKEYRECRFGSVVSDQFAEDHHRNAGKILTNAAERFEAIYPRHKSGDTATFIMAARKRLRFSNPMKEAGKYKKSLIYGPFLLKEFLKRIPLRPGHNKAFMEKALKDFEEKKTSKSAAIIENHAGRSSGDWPVDQGLVFMKSQLCTKYENRFRDAKAAQSIVCFSHAVLCRFAPYMRYIEQKVLEALPEKYYIHSGKGLDQLNEWVLAGNFNGLCTESDYEAFDASQDQYIMAFETSLMEFLGLPRDLIKDYIFIKTHLGSKLGSFAIMRFSGEASTFLFNTLANMLFTFLRYDLTGRERICFAGDDMCANQKLRVSDENAGFLGLLKLKAKVQFTTKPTFCGWNLTRYGIFKKPQLILERCCIAKERNVLAECIDNYAIELGYAYKLSELAVCEMDEEEAEAFFNCVKIVIKNKHLMKSDVRKLYEA